MYIYTLHYTDTGLYNRSVFVLPNHEAAKKAMKLNLMDPKATSFRNEVKLGNTELVALANFTEDFGLETDMPITSGHIEVICNLKDLMDDNNGNLEAVEQNHA